MNPLYTYAWGALTGFCTALALAAPVAAILVRRASFRARWAERRRHLELLRAAAWEAARQKTVTAELCGGPMDGSTTPVAELSQSILYRDLEGQIHFYAIDPDHQPAKGRIHYKHIPVQ